MPSLKVCHHEAVAACVRRSHPLYPAEHTSSQPLSSHGPCRQENAEEFFVSRLYREGRDTTHRRHSYGFTVYMASLF